tara:strand:+ start:503 stop:1447 length:945 start_codon:yes stop_codon:yes gene_type:complete
MDILLLVIGFIFLLIGGEYLVRVSVALSFRLKLSKMIIGLTVVSFATSFPELLVSLNAALKGATSIAINNVLGSNIANLGLVLGITTMFATIYMDKLFYKFYWPSMIFFSLLTFYFLANDNRLSSQEGFILFFALILFIFFLIKYFGNSSRAFDQNLESLLLTSNIKIVIWLLISCCLLYYGAEWLVEGAVDLAKRFGVSEAVISVSVVAFGTSIPELSASIIAVIKKENALSIGNLIGSNIFNLGSVLGLTAIVDDIIVEDLSILSRDIIWMLVFTAILIPLALIKKQNKLGFKEGFGLVTLYTVFMISVFFN